MYKNKKLLVISGLLVFALLFSFNSFTQASEADIGYVNFEEVYQNHPEVVATNQDFQQEVQVVQAEFQDRLAGLDQENDMEEINQVEQEFQQKVNEIRTEISGGLMEKVESDLEKIREDLGYDLILNSEIILSGGEDITVEVINYFENL
ncbi:OmpH family outer membrane protein [Halonatronum saccharophilum]|uniref:OmpH family outer membrane protein n=1 Tax=Halonatronum saccharophilum TaxID=150060 RepID=UPI000484454B|nr:OmpH family outer membrane protein [Halonatronum saccharophilum]